MQKPSNLSALLVVVFLFAHGCGQTDPPAQQRNASPTTEDTAPPAQEEGRLQGEQDSAAQVDAEDSVPPSPLSIQKGRSVTSSTTDLDDALLMGDSVLDVIGPVKGKVVADLFAGNGYYTWKLLGAGARVLAIDSDPAVVKALQARKEAAGIGDDRLLIRETQPGVPGLYPNEADLALITREFSTLGDRRQYIQQLIPGIKPPHLLYMVNFMPGSSPFGPPASVRMDFNTVADELTEYGFDDVGIYYRKLPYRYVLFANIPPENTDLEDLLDP